MENPGCKIIKQQGLELYYTAKKCPDISIRAFPILYYMLITQQNLLYQLF